MSDPRTDTLRTWREAEDACERAAEVVERAAQALRAAERQRAEAQAAHLRALTEQIVLAAAG